MLWLSPFYPTPNRDDGYDVADFYGLDPRHGSSGDFVEFMQEARARGMRVIIDLVVNHTSDRLRWFQSGREGPDAPWHGWYVWSKKRPKDWRKLCLERTALHHGIAALAPLAPASNPSVHAALASLAGRSADTRSGRLTPASGVL